MKKLTTRLQNACIVSTLLFVIGSSAQAESRPCCDFTYDACTSITNSGDCNNSWSYVSTQNKTSDKKINRCQWVKTLNACRNDNRSTMTCSEKQQAVCKASTQP